MKLAAAYIVATLLALVLAFAGAALAEPMKLTVNQAFSVSIGIDQLNKGATQIIKDGAKETQAQTPFVRPLVPDRARRRRLAYQRRDRPGAAGA